jgi:hypothetical protein
VRSTVVNPSSRCRRCPSRGDRRPAEVSEAEERDDAERDPAAATAPGAPVPVVEFRLEDVLRRGRSCRHLVEVHVRPVARGRRSRLVPGCRVRACRRNRRTEDRCSLSPPASRSGLRDPHAVDDRDPDASPPGFVGVAIALVAGVVVFLIIDMLRRIRRAGYRADVNEQLDAEAQAQADAAVEASDVDDQDIDPQHDGTNR